MPRLTEEALAATRTLARSLLAEALGMSPMPGRPAQTLAHDASRQRQTQETIADAVEVFTTKYNHLPTRNEWQHAKRWGLPAFDTVRRHYGSRAALHQAILQRRELRQALMSREET